MTNAILNQLSINVTTVFSISEYPTIGTHSLLSTTLLSNIINVLTFDAFVWQPSWISVIMQHIIHFWHHHCVGNTGKLRNDHIKYLSATLLSNYVGISYMHGGNCGKCRFYGFHCECWISIYKMFEIRGTPYSNHLSKSMSSKMYTDLYGKASAHVFFAVYDSFIMNYHSYLCGWYTTYLILLSTPVWQAGPLHL